jgi:RHS repeat-associated protein
MMERDGEIYYFIPDALGSIRALVDTKGYIRQMYEYSSFGGIRVLDEEGSPISIKDAIPNPYTFTGREFDPETGLYYYRARYYDPRLGRFLQIDPALLEHYGVIKEATSLPISIIPDLPIDPQNFNPYIYTLNNPINYIDPDGEITVIGACGIAAIVIPLAILMYYAIKWELQPEHVRNYYKYFDRWMRETQISWWPENPFAPPFGDWYTRGRTR